MYNSGPMEMTKHDWILWSEYLAVLINEVLVEQHGASEDRLVVLYSVVDQLTKLYDDASEQLGGRAFGDCRDKALEVWGRNREMPEGEADFIYWLCNHYVELIIDGYVGEAGDVARLLGYNFVKHNALWKNIEACRVDKSLLKASGKRFGESPLVY